MKYWKHIYISLGGAIFNLFDKEIQVKNIYNIISIIWNDINVILTFVPGLLNDTLYLVKEAMTTTSYKSNKWYLSSPWGGRFQTCIALQVRTNLITSSFLQFIFIFLMGLLFSCVCHIVWMWRNIKMFSICTSWD